MMVHGVGMSAKGFLFLFLFSKEVVNIIFIAFSFYIYFSRVKCMFGTDFLNNFLFLKKTHNLRIKNRVFFSYFILFFIIILKNNYINMKNN